MEKLRKMHLLRSNFHLITGNCIQIMLDLYFLSFLNSSYLWIFLNIISDSNNHWEVETKSIQQLFYRFRSIDRFFCRICHEGADSSFGQSGEEETVKIEPLISPCKCSGSVGLIHRWENKTNDLAYFDTEFYRLFCSGQNAWHWANPQFKHLEIDIKDFLTSAFQITN